MRLLHLIRYTETAAAAVLVLVVKYIPTTNFIILIITNPFLKMIYCLLLLMLFQIS